MTRSPSIAEKLAQFAIEQREFPDAVANEAKRIILDQLTCQIAGTIQIGSAPDAYQSFLLHSEELY